MFSRGRHLGQSRVFPSTSLRCWREWNYCDGTQKLGPSAGYLAHVHTTTATQVTLLRRRQEALNSASSKDDWTNAVPAVLTSRRKIMRVAQIVTTEGDATVSWPRHFNRGQSRHLQCEGNREAFVGKEILPKGKPKWFRDFIAQPVP